MVVHHHRSAGHVVDALFHDRHGLAHFLDAHEIAAIAIAVLADGDIEVQAVIDVIGLGLAQVPGDIAGAQIGSGETPIEGVLGADRPDIHRALLEDAVFRQQPLDIVDVGRVDVGERHDVVGQAIGQVLMHAAGAEISRVHARARDPLVKLHQLLALLEPPQQRRHGADVERHGRDAEDVVEQTGELREQDPDILGAQRHLDAEQPFHGEGERVLLIHRRDVVQPVKIRDGLQIGLVLDQLLRSPMEKADMGVGALDDLAIHFQHQAQHAVGRRVLGAEIHGEVLEPGLGHHRQPSAFSSPGSTVGIPSHGLRKSKLRNSWVSLTGS